MKISSLILITLISVFLFVSCGGSNTTVPPNAKKKSTLNIEAAIVYKMGGAQPLARTKFYLLNKSAEEILKAANLKPSSKDLDRILETARTRGIGNPNSLTYLDFLSIALNYPKNYPEYFAKLDAEIEKHTVKANMTDFQGKTQFDEVEPNKYFIFGTAETRGDNAIWNLPIEIKEEIQTILLDQNNAERAK